MESCLQSLLVMGKRGLVIGVGADSLCSFIVLDHERISR